MSENPAKIELYKAVDIFYSGKPLVFGNPEHIAARNRLRALWHTRHNTKVWSEFKLLLRSYGVRQHPGFGRWDLD